MNRGYITVEDFVLDPTFRSWVMDKDKETSRGWENFLLQNPEKSSLVKEAREFLLELEELESISSETSLSFQAKQKLWKEIQSGLQEKDRATFAESQVPKAFQSTEITSKIRHSAKSRSLYFYLVAASIIVFIIASGVLYLEIENRDIPESIETPWLTDSTPPGIKSSSKLPDGSVVFLNAGSSIRYREGLAGNIREIFLEGEAFFEVSKDTLRPFLVHSGNLSTQALGTSFNIRNFKEKPVEISLKTGKVRVESLDHSYLQILIPGEGISESEGTLVKSKVDMEIATAWMNKTIVFESEEFSEVISELENWFGANIILTNLPQKPASITAKYVNESLENILFGLSYKMGFAYEIKGSQVEINFNPNK